MKLRYDNRQYDEDVQPIAEKLLAVLLESADSYDQADAALCAAQEMLVKNTRPVSL